MNQDASRVFPEDRIVSLENELYILDLSLKTVSEALDRLVGVAMKGYVSKGDLDRARAYLPEYCEHAFKK
jgi:hypothetical protein